MNARAIKRWGAAAGTLALLLALAGCGGSSNGDGTENAPAQTGTSTLPQTSEPSNLNPADFTTNIDNPYFPLPVGGRWVIRVTDQEGLLQHEVMTVTNQAKKIADGVTARVVHDVVSEDGKPAEITDDYYAQDGDGNVWYFGEDTTEFKNGKKDKSGSFEAGIDGADAGVIMPAHPQVGMTYREEWSKGQAEDRSQVLGLDEQAEVPFGHFTDVLMTKDYSPLEPDVMELKFYAKGIGQVLAQTVSGGSEREELISYTH